MSVFSGIPASRPAAVEVGGASFSIPVLKFDHRNPVPWGTSTRGYGQANMIAGYAGDGDSIYLPTSSADSVTHWDKAGTIVWQKTLASFTSATDEWAGFFFKGDKLYIMIMEPVNTPDSFKLFSVDVAGTIVSISGASFQTPAGGFSIGDSLAYNLLSTTMGCMQMQYDPTNNDIILVQYDTDSAVYTQFARMSITTGLFTTAVVTLGAHYKCYRPYISGDGLLLASTMEVSIAASTQLGAAYNMAAHDMRTYSDNRGLTSLDFQSTQYNFVGYQNDRTGVDVVFLCYAVGTNSLSGHRCYGRENLDLYMRQLAHSAGGAAI